MFSDWEVRSPQQIYVSISLCLVVRENQTGTEVNCVICPHAPSKSSFRERISIKFDTGIYGVIHSEEGAN
jgi:hypothetical protein